MIASAAFWLHDLLWSGTYIGIIVCNLLGCEFGEDTNGNQMNEFAIVHPFGYSEFVGQIELSVCVDSSPPLVAPTERAIRSWNKLVPALFNCQGCRTAEEGPVPAGQYDAYTAVLHELGHCAMALGHFNLIDGTTPTSFSNVAFPALSDDGLDDVRGSADDEHFIVAPGDPLADNLTWFREADNDPFILHNDPIDSSSFSRNVNPFTGELPGDDTWAANANVRVAELLGYSQSQGVMYIAQFPVPYRLGAPSSDDVNMVMMARSGANQAVGGVPDDDYSVTLTYESDCTMADIRVQFGETAGAVGLCRRGFLEEPFMQNPLFRTHYRMTKNSSGFLDVVLDINRSWDFSTIFADSFESGNCGGWDEEAQ